MDERIIISIIGTASSKNVTTNEILLNKSTWDLMCQKAEQYVEEKSQSDWSKVSLVSGGAAWSDHLAIHLHLKHNESKLTLHFPCKWDKEKTQYLDNGFYHWSKNPGKTANTYHKQFGKKIGENTLQQIQLALSNGATCIDTYAGFHDRNKAVGQCQYMLAFSFGEGESPTDGGTSHTWKLSKCISKLHCSIPKLRKN